MVTERNRPLEKGHYITIKERSQISNIDKCETDINERNQVDYKTHNIE